MFKKRYEEFYGLIEVAPYWNVNCDGVLIVNCELTIEVAPYWNVNKNYEKTIIITANDRSSSILECKYGS